MKKSSLVTHLMTITLLTGLVLAGCKKENSDTLSPEQEEEAAMISSESQAGSELVFNEVFDNVMGVNADVGIGGTGVFGKRMENAIIGDGREMEVDSSACFTVQVTHLNPPSIFPVKVVIDFGNGCQGIDGHTRYGKIIVVYTGRLIIPGSSAMVEFDGFKLNNISVQGKFKIANTTANTPGANMKQFTITVTNAKLGTPNGNYTEWKANRVITQIEGNGTLLPLDDILKMEGSAQGRVKKGNVLVGWKSEITEPLIKKFTCPWIVRGIVKTRRDALPSNSPWTAVLNFGEGNCDYLATLSLNGNVHNIELPH